MSTFLRFVVHYIFRGFFVIVRWWKLQYGARDGNRTRSQGTAGQDLSEMASEPFQCVDVQGRNMYNERDLGDDVNSVTSIADDEGFLAASTG